MKEITELTTILDFIRWGATQFNSKELYYGHGTDNAWDDAIALILGTLRLPFDINPHVLSAHITLKEREQLYQLIMRRIDEQIPVPYLTKEAWFAGLPFYVDNRVLIPRSPIAEIIEQQFNPWINPDSVENILDLCTGSGCIAIARANYFPHALVDACDISEDALNVAKINIAKHQVEDQVHLYRTNLFNGLPDREYDLIISNPPYVDANDLATLPAEFKHEPKLALEAGKDGLDSVTEILKKSARFLTMNGVLVVEVGNSELALVEKYPDVPFTWLEFQKAMAESFY